MVACVNLDGNEIARGLSNYSFQDVTKIMQKSSEEIKDILGYVNGKYLIHCDNLVLLS